MCARQIGDLDRAVSIRRQIVSEQTGKDLSGLPHEHYDWSQVMGQCCERVVGYVPIPVGVIGPLMIDGKMETVPMATTEGALIASTNRGGKAATVSGGITTAVTAGGMTRAPVVCFKSLTEAAEFKKWIDNPESQDIIQTAFRSTTRFGKLLSIRTTLAGRQAYLRFQCDSGDAMGMNMVSKGVDAVLTMLGERFPSMDLVAISGNYCTDKKPAAVNWILGRGRSVVAEAVIKADVVESVLKTTTDALVKVNTQKNYIGSAMAGSVGGFNAHASNLLTAAFLACGQDPAQNVESSQCITIMDKEANGDLYISVTMPCIEVGTIGGGTTLGPQQTCLSLMDVAGPSAGRPGENGDRLAQCIAATVLCGELSLVAALSSGDLVKAHLKLNRKQ